MQNKLSVKKKIAMFTAIFIAVVGTLLFAWASPETTFGYWMFRCVYASPISKKPFLEAYRANLVQVEGGYIPEKTDQFLCSRLEATSSQTEVYAIANFYVLQASGRETKGIISLPESAKPKVTGSIMQHLDNYDEWQAGRALLLVEEIRRGEEIWKGSFAPVNNHESANWVGWWQKRGLNKVKSLYRKWWQSQVPWASKKKQNPLANSGIVASGP